MNTNNIFTLPDGRRLGYADYGDPAGSPVLLFHGTPGSRFMRNADEGIALRLRARLIVVERPGYGLSDPQPRRRLRDWPRDVAALAAGLGLDRFAVIGVSGGGPYALACAYALPQQVCAVALVAGAGMMHQPGAGQRMLLMNRVGLVVGRRAPAWLVAGPITIGSRLIVRYADPLMTAVSRWMPPSDRAILALREVRPIMIETATGAFESGPNGLISDMAVLARPWGFSLAQVRQPVYLWHGEHDVNVPIATARRVARALPNCRATFLRGHGHELLHSHWEEILGKLMAEDG